MINIKSIAIKNKNKKQLFNSQLLLVFIIILICIIATVVNKKFLSLNNIINIFQQIAVLGIVSSGVGMLLVAGEIDISVGNQVSLLGVILAMVIQKVLGLPDGKNIIPGLAPFAIPLAVIITILSGAFLGFLNGIFVIKTKAPSFIITLGFSLVYSGIALLLTNGASYMLFGHFETLGRGKLFNFIPISIFFFLLAIITAFIILKYTKYGRFLYAVGGNREAAYVSGIKTQKIILIAYVIVGILSSIAALILISRVGSALANTGDSYSLDALAAVIVGGIALSGGRGNAISIFLGVILIGLINNSLIIMNVNPFARGLVIGLVMIIAVTSNYLSNK